MILKKDFFLSLLALVEANHVKFLTDLFEKLHPPLLSLYIVYELNNWSRNHSNDFTKKLLVWY